MPVVTISRQLGSLGDEIAKSVGSALELKCTDKTSLEQVLVEHGFPERKFEMYDEKKPSFWESLSSDTQTYVHFLKSAILQFVAERGGVVVGRGGSCVLSGVPGVLNVRIVAPFDVRAARIGQREQCEESHARRIVQQSDGERGGFYHYFFGIDWNAPEQYDLTINTGTVDARNATDIILATLSTDAFAGLEADTQDRLEDMRLAQAVETQLLYEEHIPVRFFEAHAKEGVVHISGTVPAQDLVDRSEEIARAVPGVEEVVQEIHFVPEYTSVIG